MVGEGGVAGCELSYVAVMEGEELGRDELFARYVSLSFSGIGTREWGGCYPRRIYSAGPILQFPQLWCQPRPRGQISRPEKNTWSLLWSIQTLVLLSSLLNGSQSSVINRGVGSEERDHPQKMQSPSVSSSGRTILIILNFPSRNTPPSKPSSFSFFSVFMIGHHVRCCA